MSYLAVNGLGSYLAVNGLGATAVPGKSSAGFPPRPPMLPSPGMQWVLQPSSRQVNALWTWQQVPISAIEQVRQTALRMETMMPLMPSPPPSTMTPPPRPYGMYTPPQSPPIRPGTVAWPQAPWTRPVLSVIGTRPGGTLSTPKPGVAIGPSVAIPDSGKAPGGAETTVVVATPDGTGVETTQGEPSAANLTAQADAAAGGGSSAAMSAPAASGMPGWAIPAALAAVAGLWWMKSKKKG